jgi:RNA polymerase sigma factor (sigma-70 family)
MYVAWPQIRASTRHAYARKAIVNAYLDERRRPFFRREHITAEIPDVVSDEVPRSHAESEVFRALSDLPPRMRAAVILRHLHDVSVAETAQILGCSEGTVKSQTARGLTQLRSKLSDLLRDDDPTAAGVPKSYQKGE